jgi:hypothetical protein
MTRWQFLPPQVLFASLNPLNFNFNSESIDFSVNFYVIVKLSQPTTFCFSLLSTLGIRVTSLHLINNQWNQDCTNHGAKNTL